jgi:hypothetical protein
MILRVILACAASAGAHLKAPCQTLGLWFLPMPSPGLCAIMARPGHEIIGGHFG